MEKISGIIPSSARVSAVDMKEAAPVRPGAPGFGRPTGVSSLKESLPPQDTARRGATAQLDQMDWRSKDVANAMVVQNIAEGFFAKNRKEVDSPVIARQDEMVNVKNAPIFQSSIASKPTGFRSDELKPIRMPAAEFDEEVEQEKTEFEHSTAPSMPPVLQQPEGFYPRGSFINRVA